MLRLQMDTVPRSPGTDITGVYELIKAARMRAERQEFSLSSESFEDGGTIPDRLAGEQGVSPQLSWKNVSEDASRLVIIMDDPDAQAAVGYTFVHWVATVPTYSNSLPEGASAGGWTGQHKILARDSTSTAYRGPKPPSGTHRYHIAIYAMSGAFDDPEFQDLSGSAADDTKTCTREHFEALYHRDILTKAEITGTYSARPEAAH